MADNTPDGWLAKTGDVCSIVGLPIAIILGIVTIYEWRRTGVFTVDLGMFVWFSVMVLMMLTAGWLQWRAVLGRQKLAAATQLKVDTQPPTRFEPSAYRLQELPVTKKEAILDPTPGRAYPLKVYCEFVNNTADCTEVKVSRWVSGIKAEAFREVLQLWMDRAWCPTPDGVALLHVPPGGQFRLWIAPAKQYSREELQRQCDEKRLGTLALLINQREREIIL